MVVTLYIFHCSLDEPFSVLASQCFDLFNSSDFFLYFTLTIYSCDCPCDDHAIISDIFSSKISNLSLTFFVMSFYVCVLSHPIVPDSLWPHGLQPARLLCPWNFPGMNTGLGCHFLFQGIFPTQGSYCHLLHLLHWQADSLPLRHLRSSCAAYLFLSSFSLFSTLSISLIHSYPFITFFVRYVSYLVMQFKFYDPSFQQHLKLLFMFFPYRIHLEMSPIHISLTV